jgi:hypothetical protein
MRVVGKRCNSSASLGFAVGDGRAVVLLLLLVVFAVAQGVLLFCCCGCVRDAPACDDGADVGEEDVPEDARVLLLARQPVKRLRCLCEDGRERTVPRQLRREQPGDGVESLGEDAGDDKNDDDNKKERVQSERAGMPGSANRRRTQSGRVLARVTTALIGRRRPVFILTGRSAVCWCILDQPLEEARGQLHTFAPQPQFVKSPERKVSG